MEKKPKLQVSSIEAKTYQSVYKKIEKNVIAILQNKQKCIEFLMKKGSIQQDIAEQIYDKAIKLSDKQEEQILDQHSFFCLLKFLAAAQNSIDINSIESIYDIKVLPLPQLTPGKKKSNSNNQSPLSSKKEILIKQQSLEKEQKQLQDSDNNGEQQGDENNKKNNDSNKQEIEEEKKDFDQEDQKGNNKQQEQKKQSEQLNKVIQRPRTATFNPKENQNKKSQQELDIDIESQQPQQQQQKQVSSLFKEEQKQVEDDDSDSDSEIESTSLKKQGSHHIRTATFGEQMDPQEQEQVQKEAVDQIQLQQIDNKENLEEEQLQSEQQQQTKVQLQEINSSHKKKKNKKKNKKFSQNSIDKEEEDEEEQGKIRQNKLETQLQNQQQEEADSVIQHSTNSSANSSPQKGLNFSGIMEHKLQMLKGGLQKVNEDYNKNVLHSRYESIKILSFEEKQESFLSKTYVVYSIQTKLVNKDRYFEVSKRYSDFVELDNYFKNNNKYQSSIIPKIPPKNYINQINTILGHSDQQFIQQRQTDLQIYLQNILEHEQLQNDPIVEGFLTQDNFQTPQEYQKSLFENVGNLVNNLANYNMQDFKNISTAYIKVKWDQYMKYDEEEKIQELGELVYMMEKVDNYEKLLQGCRKFMNKQQEANEIKRNSISQLIEIMPSQMDFKQVSKFKISMFDYVEKYQSDQQQQRKNEKNLEISIKKQLSCIYGIKQQYDNLCQLLFEMNYYNQLSQQHNNTEEQRKQILEYQKKQNKHKNEMKIIFQQEVQKFIDNIQENVNKTLKEMKLYQQEEWDQLK